MFDRSKIAADFSAAAEKYSKHANLQHRIGKALIALSVPHIASAEKLLDVGAGDGEVTLLWPCPSKTALDVAEGMCAQARKRGLETVMAPAERLPFESASFDVVTSNVMLQWLPEPVLFYAEAARVLAAGGLVCFSNFTAGTLAELASAFRQVTGDSPVSPFISHGEFEAQIAQAGFELLESQQKTYAEYYEHVDALFASLRNIGAGNKLATRGRGLLTPRKLDAVRKAYSGTVASWQVSMVVARKQG